MVLAGSGCSSAGSTASAAPAASAAPTASAAASPSASAVSAGTYQETKITYPSRDVQVPAEVVIPDGSGSYPLVVLCHGHGGSKDENGGFTAVADALAEQGIASIRMDFPGCGDSTEDFSKNTLTNMKEDVKQAIAYATANYPVNKDKVGIFGYSMGGRIALELLAESAYDFKSVVLLAPAADTDDLKGLFGGADAFAALQKEAEDSTDGYAEYTTIYGQKQNLSKEWFSDLEANPGNSIVAKAAAKYTGPALVIHAVDDEAVHPAVSENVAAALSAETIETPEDGHSYGFYSDKTAVKNLVAYGTAAFFNANLNQ